jgi:hypothetical protein
MWVVSRWLTRVGENSFAALKSALRPAAVVQGAENAFLASLLVGRDIGLLAAVDDSGPWSLGPRLQQDAVGDHRTFRRAVREALLTKAVDDALAGRQPADVAIGLTWLCSLDPMRPPAWGWSGSNGTEQVVRNTGQLDQVISNSTQWRAFRRWAIDLGVAVANSPPRGAAQVLVPDPTTAVSETLHRLPQRATAPEFIAALRLHLPIIDTGQLESVARALGVKYARGDATIGPSISHALLRLQRREVLSLITTDDASHRVSYRTSVAIDAFDEVVISGGSL